MSIIGRIAEIRAFDEIMASNKSDNDRQFYPFSSYGLASVTHAGAVHDSLEMGVLFE